MSHDPEKDIWRVPGRLNTDDATIAYLVDVASRQSAITRILQDIRPEQQDFANGSIWASGIARADGTRVLLKLGSSAAERDWTVAIDAAADNVVPRVFGAGEFDGVGWLALERCDCRLDPVSGEHRAAVVATVARFHEAACRIDADSSRADLVSMRRNLEVDDLSSVRSILEAALGKACPGDVEGALGRLEAHWEFVAKECGVEPIHGDVHFRNVVAREPDGPALLIDAMPKKTLWAWDAADLQLAADRHLADAHLTPEPTSGRGLIHLLAEARAQVGLPTPSDLERVAALALGWAAARWWWIAPWRHDQPAWREQVRQRIDALT